jgi:hypothetical protein
MREFRTTEGKEGSGRVYFRSHWLAVKMQGAQATTKRTNEWYQEFKMALKIDDLVDLGRRQVKILEWIEFIIDV